MAETIIRLKGQELSDSNPLPIDVTPVYTTKTITIAEGASLSAVVDLEQLNIVGLLMPAEWTAADITFQASPDNSTFGNVANSEGNEVKVIVAAGKFVGATLPELSGIRYLKIRSGTADSPVNQEAARSIKIVLTSNPESSSSANITGATGTEYTEDAAAVANPVGPMNMAVRADSLADAVSTDGDNIALRATNKGELYVKNSSIESYTSRLLSSAHSNAPGSAMATTAFAVGGTYNATPPTFTDGQQGGIQLNAKGEVKVEKVEYSYGRVTADGQIKSGAGLVHTVTFSATGTVTAGVITIYDSTDESGTVIWSGLIQTGLNPLTIMLDVAFTNGLYVGYDGTIQNVGTTVSYR